MFTQFMVACELYLKLARSTLSICLFCISFQNKIPTTILHQLLYLFEFLFHLWVLKIISSHTNISTLKLLNKSHWYFLVSYWIFTFSTLQVFLWLLTFNNINVQRRTQHLLGKVINFLTICNLRHLRRCV
jgi:hypothetical protein